MEQQMQRRNSLDEVNWDHRQHTRKGGMTGMQTGGIISDTADAIGDGADWALGVPGDTLKGIGDLTGNAWDWGVGGAADATSETWDWAVGGTADATDETWDWAAGGAADSVPGVGGWGSQQDQTQQSQNGQSNQDGQSSLGSLVNPTTMMIGGAAILGVGGLYYINQE